MELPYLTWDSLKAEIVLPLPAWNFREAGILPILCLGAISAQGCASAIRQGLSEDQKPGLPHQVGLPKSRDHVLWNHGPLERIPDYPFRL